MNEFNEITVTSHVSRDFLQNSQYFNTIPKIVWEYVANSLDASEEGTFSAVSVELTSNYLKISDNGRGMTRDELKNFFQMHGENIQRKRGKRVRGRFGTGKSAAFGLANDLTIDTTRNGLKNIVQLCRDDIELAQNGQPFPVRDITVDEITDEDNGTTVQITSFNIRRPNVNEVIAYVERHLSRYRQRAHVIINGHECKFEEPKSIEEFKRTPPEEIKSILGDIELTVKVSPTPLDAELKGIDILSHGIWHGTSLAGIEKRERANYLFGYTDVPILEDGEWPIPPFDNTRNNTLNIQNPAVAMLLGWLEEELEQIRIYLVNKERSRQKSEQAKQLRKEAERIAEVLNEHFSELEMELELSRRIAKRSGGKKVDEIIDEMGNISPGNGNVATPLEQTGNPHGSGKRGKEAGSGDTRRPGPDMRSGSEEGSKKSTVEGKRKRRKSVFSIDYKNESTDADRSRYEADSKTIIINLDHPQISVAFEGGGKRTDSKQFREICYEVAAVEYALAIPFERLERDELYTADEALYDVKETINDITRRFMLILDGA